MLRVLKISSLILGLIVTGLFVLPTTTAANDTLNLSPVVQVMTYTKVQDKYLQVLGWGSASVISKEGYLLTNNHVVLDGQGNVASEFSVCMTEQERQTPRCEYTATLIGRDETMDIAILKLDPKTVLGTTVDFFKLKTIDVDYEYVPKTQDTVLLVGFPWIGSDTITETKGIVSGVARYNDFDYIKTDATIAGGNSGGAMINVAGKLIGVPTYSVGGFFDASLGYALSIGQAKTFIAQTVAAPLQAVDYSTRLLPTEKKKIALLKAAGKVDDQLMQLVFGVNYEVDTYIENTMMSLKTFGQKDTMEQVMISREQTPVLDSEKDFLRYLQMRGIYTASYQKPIKSTLAGMTCYTPAYKDESVYGDSVTDKTYLCQATNQMMVTIATYMMTSSGDQKLLQAAKDRIGKLLETLQIKKEYSDVLIARKSLELKDPFFQVKSGSGTIIYDGYDAVIQQMGSFQEYLSVNLTQSAKQEDVYKNRTEGISEIHKSELKFQGKKGYVVCNEPYFGMVSNPIFMGYYEDEKEVTAIPRELSSCTITVYEGIKNKKDDAYELNIIVTGYKDTLKQQLEAAYTFMNNQVSVTEENIGETNLPNILTHEDVVLHFKDLTKQKPAFLDKIKVMINLGLLKDSEYFYPEYVLKWKDILPIYIKIVFKTDIFKDAPQCGATDKVCALLSAESTVAEQKIRWKTVILDKMNLDLNGYVNADTFTQYMELFYYTTAGIDISKLKVEDIYTFRSETYKPISEKKWQKEHTILDAFSQKLNGEKVTNSYELQGYYSSSDDSYLPAVLFYFHPTKGLISDKVIESKDDKMLYLDYLKNTYGRGAYLEEWTKNYEEDEELNKSTLNCLKTQKNALACVTTYLEKNLANSIKTGTDLKYHPKSFPVLTKGQMIDVMVRAFDNYYFNEQLQKVKG